MMNGEACHGACPQATTPLRPVAAGADPVCWQDPTGNLDVPDAYPGNTPMPPVFHDGGPAPSWSPSAAPRESAHER